MQFALDQGIAISWSLWALAAVVPGAVSLVVMPLVIYRLCPPGAVKSPDAHAAAKPPDAPHGCGASVYGRPHRPL